MRAFFLTTFLLLLFLDWKKKEFTDFHLYYTTPDEAIISTLEKDVHAGIKETKSFFDLPFKKRFDVYIFPNRDELNKQWRKDWNMPDFNSQCWMVASGVANRLDVLSPLSWKKEACDHNPSDSVEISRIIFHEL